MLVAVAIGVYVRRKRLSLRYLDAVAIGFALGLGIGRMGDVINGEHYGPASDFFLAVRNTHPQADTPDPAVAYHSGGLYGSDTCDWTLGGSLVGGGQSPSRKPNHRRHTRWARVHVCDQAARP